MEVGPACHILIYPIVHLSFYPSFHTFIKLSSICPSLLQFIYISSQLSSIHPSITYPAIHLSIFYPPMHLSIHYKAIIYPSTQPSSTHLSIHL
jgi:hypothetical protein